MLVNDAVFSLVVVPVQIAFALWLAILVNRRLCGAAFFRTAYFAPAVTIIAVTATVRRLRYDPDVGTMNAVLRAVSAGHLSPGWLQGTTPALPAAMIMSIWQGVGFQIVILLAGLQDVDPGLYEAAEMDGAGHWQQFRHVTLPGIRNQLVFVATVTTVLSFRLFDQVYAMTSGGPLDSTRR